MKKSILLLALFSLLSIISIAQPANNNCGGAINLGTLPTPGACVSGLQNGVPVTVAGTTVGATATSPALSVLNCQGGTADQFAPSPDVWYMFTASGTTVNINITGGTAPVLANPNIGLWTGPCNALTPMGCAIGNAAGNLSGVFTQIMVGQTYYIQVGGGNTTSTGNFNISVDNDIDCNNCNQVSSMTATPAPTFGAYAPGTVVHFCYTVSNFVESNTNWFHGVQISMGSGWTGAVSNPVPATDCNVDVTPGPGNAGAGTWRWYPTGVTSSATGVSWPMGFYFDNANVGGTNAGQNFGDPGNCGWTFCWDLTVAAGCAPGSDLTVTVGTTGDGESGSWASAGCAGDPNYVFNAQGACCPPNMASTPTCVGQSTGTATATPIGAGPFTYSWAPSGGTAATATGLAAGTYTVTVTNTTSLCAVTNTVTVTTNPLPVSNAGADITICSGASGSLGTTSTTGNSYSWSPTTGLSSSTVSNPTVTLTNAGTTAITQTYTVTTTITATGCTSTDVVIVTVNPQPVIVAPAPVTVCAGSIVPAGAVTSTPAGATFAWTNSNTAIGLAASGTGQVPSFTATNTGTAPISGTITITPTLSGCPGVPVTYTITVNPVPASTFTQTANMCLSGNSFTFTNTATMAAGYTQSWNFGGGGASPASSTTSPVTVTYTTAGTYTITHVVTAAGGCTSTTTSTITIFSPPTAIATTTTPASCGASNGSVTLGAVTGGTAPYTYSFNGGAFGSTTSFTALAAGTYTIVVKDANGCTYTTTVTVTSSTAPTALVVTNVSATCGGSNGIINIGTVTGGTAPYTYSVNGSAFTSTTSYSGFAAGTYTVIVKDANGCTFTTTTTIVNIPGPTALAVTTVNSTCGASNGVINIGATTGGTAPYTYSVNGSAFTSTLSYTGLAAGTYTIIVKDANGCQFTTTATVANTPGPTALAMTSVNPTCGNSNGSITLGAVTGGTAAYTYSVNGGGFTSTTTYTSLAAGTYTIIVKDANGCQFTTTQTITNIPGPTALATTTTNASCGASNGSITIGAVTGGTLPYTYSVNGSAFTTTTNYTGLAANTYPVIVQDANGCQFSTTATVPSSSGPTALVVTTTNAPCGGSTGTITIGAVTGGVAPYTYSVNASAFTATTSYSGFAAGTYVVIVKDVNGCTFSVNAVVNPTPGPSALVVTNTSTTCGNSNGTITIGTVTGGTAPFTYSVNGSAFTSSTSYTALAAGTYTVIVKDANGCTFTTTTTITNIPGPTAVATTLTNTTCSNANGTVNIGVVTGGTAPYTYSFNGSGFTGTTSYTSLMAGTYTIVVKDANGCTFTTTVTLTNSPGPTAQATTTNPSTCGLSNGAINIGATTGGTPAYTYSFNGGGFSTTTSYTGLAAGTYTVTVKDANGCTFTVNPVITNVPGPTALATTVTNSTCGGANGAITIGATTGGTAPYTYSVGGSPLSTTTSYTGLLANTYTIIVQDANGCQFTTTATVNDLSGLVANITGITNVSCFGGSNGSVTVTASGSTAPYSYSFNGGTFGSSGTFSGLTQGSYTVTAKDGNGCTVTVNVPITQPSVLNGNIVSQTNVLCFGGNTGAVTVSATGGTTPYSFSLDGGTFGSSTSFTGLTAGTHTITVKDGNGCTTPITVVITQPTLLALATSVTNAICTAANGSATVVATGGTPVYTYQWTPSLVGTPTAATDNGITAGNYTVTVTDNNGCIKTAPVIVGSNPGGTAVISSTTNVTCTGANDGTATVSMGAGATPPFSYVWTPGSQTTVTAVGLAPGTYSVTVTDGNGCVSITNTLITQPTMITNTFTNINVSCFGGANGVSTVSANGGTPPYTYLWTPSSQTTATASNLSAGTYTVVITDANGCTHTATTAITQPTGMTLTETHVDANCSLANGSANVIVAGGVGPYTYSWSSTPVQTTSSATNLAANTYVVTVTDANGCSQTLSVTINNLAGPTATLFSQTNVSCNGNNDGAATVTVAGGTMPYTFTWDNGQTLPTATNLTAGTYTLVATDVNGCVASTSVTITQPTALNLGVTGTDPTCFGLCNGTLNSTPTGGTAPYTYLWNPGGLTTQNATGLCAGTYTLQVTDAHGCIVFNTFTLNNPAAVTASTTTTNVTCSGLCNGTSTANPLTGTGPYTFQWSDINHQTTGTASGLCAGSYTVVVTDANGCTANATATVTTPAAMTVSIIDQANNTCYNACDGYATAQVAGGTAPYLYSWSPILTVGASVNNLCAANYTVTVTDVNGCNANTTVNITQPPPLLATITSTDVTCYNLCDGSANAVYTGGTGPYTFQWTPTMQTTPNIASLCAGVYNLTVTDGNGCTALAAATVQEPTILAVTTTTTPSTCGNSDGSACASITGGVPPFAYSWNDPSFQTTNCANSISAGVYTITITDAHNCSITGVANVNDLTAPVVTIPVSTDVTCAGAANGSAQGAVSGGTLPYNYMWTPSSQTTLFASNLSGGIYSFVVTDGSGCIGSASVTINEPTPLLSAIIASTPTSCNLACDGSATVLAGGGTLPYTYLWNDVATQTTTTATGLCAAGYTVTATDANGCTTNSIVNITQPNAVTITLINKTNPDCFGGSNGSININAGGGTPGYTYSWTPAVGSGPMVTGLPAGTYTVDVTDAHGCSGTMSYTLTEPSSISLSTISNPSTCGNSNGFVSVSPAGGTPGYSYLWSDASAQTTAIATSLSANTYSVTVTDSHGCTADTTVVLLNQAGPTISTITYSEPTCHGLPLGTATVVPTGGTPVYTYLWSGVGAQTTQTASALTAGVYTVTVTDQNGCTVTGSVNVTEPAPLSVIPSPTDTICIGGTSQIYGAGYGGTPAYTYVWSPLSFPGAGPNSVTPVVTTTYGVYVVDANGCESAPQPITVFVNPPISLVATGGVICAGQTGNLNAVATGGNGGPYSYSWTPGSGLSSATAQNPTASPTATTIYTVTVDDGCTMPFYGVSDTAQITVLPNPVSFIVANDTAGCEAFTVNFTGLSDIGINYTWNFGDGSPAQNGQPVTHTYPNAGTYTVSLTTTSGLGCSSTVTNTDYITVYPSPTAAFSYSPTSLTESAPLASFFNESTPNPLTYAWDFDFPGGGTMDTLQNPTYAYTDSGTYTVQLIVINNYGCTDTAYHELTVTPEYIFYAPNAFTPTNHDGVNDTFFPKGIGIDPNNFKMMIFDRWGNMIYSTEDINKGWDGRANGGDNIAQRDVYVWKVFTKDPFGGKHEYIGRVTLVR